MLDPQQHCPEGVVYLDGPHTYTIDGKHAPGVSSILKVINPDQYAMIDPRVMEAASQRGSAGHDMIALDVRDELDEMSLSGHLVPKYAAWCQAQAELKIEVSHSELVVVSRANWYCGMLDLICTLAYKGSRDEWLLDAKFTAQLPPLVGVQLEGYSVAAEEMKLLRKGKYRRGCLWIKDGKYQLVEQKRPNDRSTFLAGRNILNWRDING